MFALRYSDWVFFNNDCLFLRKIFYRGIPENLTPMLKIDEMEAALRDSLASIERHSFRGVGGYGIG